MKDIQEIRKRYDTDGYAVFEGGVSAEDLEPIFQTIYRVYRNLVPGHDELEETPLPWHSDLFHEKLLQLRTEDSQKFGALYDSIQSSVGLHQLMNSQKVLGYVASLLDDEPYNLSICGYNLIMAPPFDQRNRVLWHQDYPYYPQNESGNHGAICWIPLQPVSAENGSLAICLGSHKDGVASFEHSQESGGVSSEQFMVSEETLNKYEMIDLVSDTGDVAFLSLLLLHQSGSNSSNRFRFVAGARYHQMIKPDFRSFSVDYLRPELVESR